MDFKIFLPLIIRRLLEPDPEPEPDPPEFVVVDIVNQLPVHPTKKYKTRPLAHICGIAVHHTATAPTTPWNVATYQINRPPPNDFPGIGYHYFIMPDGLIYQTQYWNTISWHVGSPNWKSLGICLNGNFMQIPPTPHQLLAGHWLVNHLYSQLNITEMYGHRDYPYGTATVCPGNTYTSWLPDMFQID
jgi:N-acetylmuramoyl-L-alanine amidase